MAPYAATPGRMLAGELATIRLASPAGCVSAYSIASTIGPGTCRYHGNLLAKGANRDG
jgi:hypothetical protein